MGHYSAVRGEEGDRESLWPWGRQVLSNGDTEELPGEKAELRRVRRAWGKSPGGSTGWAGAHRAAVRRVPAPGRWSQSADIRPSGTSQGQSVTQAEVGASRASRRLGSEHVGQEQCGLKPRGGPESSLGMNTRASVWPGRQGIPHLLAPTTLKNDGWVQTQVYNLKATSCRCYKK